MQVVVPAAGRGTRFYPITRVMPKEMLPVLNRPVIQYVIDEALGAGAQRIVIITGQTKRVIQEYVQCEYRITGEHQDIAPAEADNRKLAPIVFVEQGDVNGLGGALLSACESVSSDPFGVLLGDSIHVCEVPLLSQLRSASTVGGRACSVVALEPVSDEQVSSYGVVTGPFISDRVVEVESLVEKPDARTVKSRLAITGAYYLSQGVFRSLRQTEPDAKGEVQLTNALSKLLESEPILGLVFQGRRYDTGTPERWLRTNVEMARLSRTLDPALAREIALSG